MGKLRSGTQSDLLKSITSICDTATVPNAPKVSAKILDGSTLVHMLSPGQSKHFGEYAKEVFIPFLRKELSMVSRLDIVWDIYNSDSLKNTTREKCGTGQKTRVSAMAKIPKSWGNFLRDNSNKEGLFHLLSIVCQSYANEIENEKEVCIIDGPNVFNNINRDTQRLAPCNHEEADTRMMVHLSDAVAQGLTKIMLRTVDTDVVVLAVAQVQELPQLEELWVHIGTGKHHQYLSCHDIATSLGTFPIDTTKTRLQVQGQKTDPRYVELRYTGMVDCFVKTSKQEGLKALYCGIWPAVLRQATYGTIKFGTYYSLKKVIARHRADGGAKESVGWNALCAAFAGAFSSAIANPTDVLKVRMQTGQENRGLVRCFAEIYQLEGVRGLWRGVGPTAQRAAVIAAVELPVYDSCKKRLLLVFGDTALNHFVSSLVASLGSAVASTPLDVIRTRLMNQRKIKDSIAKSNEIIYKGTVDCFLQTVKHEGFQALYKGFIPTWLRMGPWNIIFFITYEQLKQLY